MTEASIDPRDDRLYRRLVGLSTKQLVAIKARISGDTNRWKNLLFMCRNWRMKMTLLKLLGRKRRRLGAGDETGDGDVSELVEDLGRIEADEGAWQAVGKEELDYVQIVLHGMRQVTADTNGLLDDSA